MDKSIRVYPKLVDCVGNKQRYVWGFDKMEIGEYMELNGHAARLAELALTQYRVRNPTKGFLAHKTSFKGIMIQRVAEQTRGIATLLINPFQIVRDDLEVTRISVECRKFTLDAWAEVPEKYRKRVQQQLAQWNATSPYIKLKTSTSRKRGARPGHFIIYASA